MKRISADKPHLGRLPRSYQVTPKVLGRRRATQPMRVRPAGRQAVSESARRQPENQPHGSDVTARRSKTLTVRAVSGARIWPLKAAGSSPKRQALSTSTVTAPDRGGATRPLSSATPGGEPSGAFDRGMWIVARRDRRRLGRRPGGLRWATSMRTTVHAPSSEVAIQLASGSDACLRLASAIASSRVISFRVVTGVRWSGSLLLMRRRSGGEVMQVELADTQGVEHLHSLR